MTLTLTKEDNEAIDKKLSDICDKIIDKKNKLNIHRNNSGEEVNNSGEEVNNSGEKDKNSGEKVNNIITKRNVLIEFIKNELKKLKKDEHRKIIINFGILNHCSQFEANVDEKIIGALNDFDNLYYADEYNGVYEDIHKEKIDKVANTIYYLIVCDIPKPKNGDVNTTVTPPAVKNDPKSLQNNTTYKNDPILLQNNSMIYRLSKFFKPSPNSYNTSYTRSDYKQPRNNINQGYYEMKNRKKKGGKSKKTKNLKNHKKKTQKRKR